MKRRIEKIAVPAAALIAGAATPLGFAPYSLAFVPFLTLSVLFLVWLRADSARRAGWLGFLFGLGMFGAGVSWVYVSLHTFGNMAAPLAGVAVFGFVALLAVFPALAGWLQTFLSGLSPTLRLLLVMPAAWLLTEWLRGWVLTGFPWLSLGYSQMDWPLAGFAPVFGVYGVGLLAAGTAGFVALVGDYFRWRFFAGRTRGEKDVSVIRLRTIAAVAASLAVIWFIVAPSLGDRRWTVPSGDRVSVRLAQGNIPIMEKWRPEARQEILDVYLGLSQGGEDLVVWPEGATPDLLRRLGEPFWLGIRRLNASGSAVLFGGVEYSPEKRYYNSAVFLPAGEYADTARQLATVAIYRKTHLVPFGDYFPLPGFLRGILDYLHIPMSDFSAWDKPQALFSVKGHAVAVTICYEDAFGQELLRHLPRAQMLINISEDGWFGHSIGPLQRVQMAQMRALETGRPVLRAANTGVTALIDARGRVVSRLPQYARDVLTGDVQPMTGATPYARWGNWPTLLVVSGVLFILLLLRRRQ